MKNADKIFKAYDIRGVYPDEINEEIVYRIAQAYAVFTQAKTVAVGRDVRISSPSLQSKVIEGLVSMGVDVIDIGLGPTEMIYFAAGSLGLDGAIQVSASHNPSEYNGLKMIRSQVEALSSDNGLLEIKSLALSSQELFSETNGKVTSQDLTEKYIQFMSGFANFERDKPLKIVVNNNFGASGPLFERVIKNIKADKIELIKLNFEPDGTFPKGRPDPLVPENRTETSSAVVTTGADLAIAWDADGDRCYLADEKGVFVEGCHLTAILAEYLLKEAPGSKIIYDPRNVWATEETVAAAGGAALINKAGHTFIKNRMKQEQALFAGEMSGHFYFKNFFYADSGLIPALLFLTLLDKSGETVSSYVSPWRERYHVSGEINFTVVDPQVVLSEVMTRYGDGKLDRTDGISIEYPNWRFNLRSSNTEPLLRLNVEAKNLKLCQEKTAELKDQLSK